MAAPELGITEAGAAARVREVTGGAAVPELGAAVPCRDRARPLGEREQREGGGAVTLVVEVEAGLAREVGAGAEGDPRVTTAAT